MDFDQANQTVHAVQDQWHYETMIVAGFMPETLEAAGFVRSYTYRKPGHHIVVTTGASADYWTDKVSGKTGYWSDLAPHVGMPRPR